MMSLKGKKPSKRSVRSQIEKPETFTRVLGKTGSGSSSNSSLPSFSLRRCYISPENTHTSLKGRKVSDVSVEKNLNGKMSSSKVTSGHTEKRKGVRFHRGVVRGHSSPSCSRVANELPAAPKPPEQQQSPQPVCLVCIPLLSGSTTLVGGEKTDGSGKNKGNVRSARYMGTDQKSAKKKNEKSLQYFIQYENGNMKLTPQLSYPDDDTGKSVSVEASREEVISVSERIEKELGKSENQDPSVGAGNVSGEKEDVHMSMTRKRFMDFISNTAKTVAQRIEMELREFPNNDNESRKDVMDTVSPPDEEKNKKEGKPMKRQPEPKPGILTFTDEDLFTFLIEENSETEYMCKNCKMVFGNKDDAMRHVNVHSPYKCESCNLTFPSIRDMKNHYRYQHKEILHCTYCSFSTKLRNDFDRHVKAMHKQSNFTNFIQMVCYICGLSLRVWEPLDEHMEKEHGIEKTLMEGDFQCPLCNAISRSDQGFRDHIRKHKGDYMQCRYPNCEFRSVNQSCVNKHYESVHLGKRTHCCPFEECGTSFKDGAKLNEHLNVVHYKIRKFFCGTCGKGFLAKRHLSVHERIHSDSKPVACKFCDYRCRQTASLKWHMKQSHPEQADSNANSSSASENPYLQHCLKRGRKATGKKSVSATRKHTRAQGSKNGSKAKSSKRKKRSPVSDSEGDDSCSSGVIQDGDSFVGDELRTSVDNEIKEWMKIVSNDIKASQMSSEDHYEATCESGKSPLFAVDMEQARTSSRKRRKTERAEAYDNSLEEHKETDDSEPE